ncbi:MAG: T9SS type A sorting domain-containing protein [Chitinophagaceae bacterium]|nr:T9SS type A sorting domain-containing protein [Chitinophagaceae bacterium]
MKRKLPLLGMLLGVLCAFQLQAQPWPNPEVLYYKFENSGTTVPNDALSPPSGTTTANILGAITQGGSGGKCGNGSLVGSGVASTTDYLNTGWATNLPSGSSWTISFWTKDITPSSTLFYIFGDLSAGSFRCFTNGVAGANNWIIRGTGMTDVTVAGGATVAPHMTTFVYDAVAGNMKGYLDGVLVTTVTQSTTMSFSGTGPFKVMGYSSNVGSPSGGKLDEFRLYNRALGDVEILGLYNGPSATASSTPSPATVCAGDNLTLTGGGNGAGPYLWSDGTNFITDNTPFVPTVTGTYTVTTSDGAGCTATSTLNVTVNALPSVAASASPSTVLCGPSNVVTLSGSGASTYTWNAIPTVGSDTVLNPAVVGTYTVTGTDANGCSATSTITLSIGTPPTASNVNACAGDAIQLSANGEQLFTGSLSAALPTWNRPVGGIPPTGLSGVGTSVYYSTHTFTVPISGQYELASTISSSFDGFGVLYQNAFNPLTPLVNALDASDDEIFIDEPVITANLVAGTTYIYVHTSFDNGATGNYSVSLKKLPATTFNWYTQASGGSIVDNSNPFNPINDAEVLLAGGVYGNLANSNTPGTYDFWVEDAFSPGCRTQVTLTIGSVPVVSASASSPTVCMAAPLTLTASGATTYSWNPGGSGSSITVYPLANTTYTVTGTDGGVCTATSTVSINVTPPSISAPTVTEDSVCAPGGVVSLSAVGSNSVTWYDAPIGGSQLSTSSNYSPTISASTTFYVENSGTSWSPPTYVTMPAQTSTFSTNARGYWFTAPSNFVITGLYVPTTASSGAQNIAVLKFTGNVAPPVFSATTNAFTVEFLTQNNATTGVIPVNIPVSAGEVIGIFGNRANVNSYSNVGNTITINGSSVALTRLGMQFPLGSTSPQDVWQEPVSGNISRVEFEYSLAIPGCPSFPRTPVTGTVNPLPLVTAGITPGTICANASALPQGGGAQTYVWDNGLVDGQVFIPPVGTTQYMVTGTDANGCSATSTVNVTATTLSGQLAASTTSQTQLHGDDLNLQYADISCNLIAGVDDNLGNALGITTATVTVDATAQFHNGQPYVRRWYQITPASNGSADVVLYVNQSDFDDYNAVVLPPYLPMPTSGNNSDPNIPNIRITKNDDAGLGVNPIVITPTVNWNGQYWELAFNTPSFSQFRIHSVNMFNAPLPVVVTEFKGQMLETSDLISWTTSTEINSDYFVVEYSQDAKNFQAIATVASKAPQGNSQLALNYQIEYKMPQRGHNYYRLKQVDLDQKSSYHAKVIDLLRTDNNGVVKIYPNPANEALHIDWNAQKAAQVEIKVIDMSGRTVHVTALQAERGAQTASIALNGLSAGVYSVQFIENGSTRFTGRFTKN